MRTEKDIAVRAYANEKFVEYVIWAFILSICAGMLGAAAIFFSNGEKPSWGGLVLGSFLCNIGILISCFVWKHMVSRQGKSPFSSAAPPMIQIYNAPANRAEPQNVTPPRAQNTQAMQPPAQSGSADYWNKQG